MIPASVEGSRQCRLAPIAGIPFEHLVGSGLDVAFPDTARWRGSVSREEPVVVVHRIGAIEWNDLEPVVDSAPWSTYYRDSRGQGAARFHAQPPWTPEHLLRTIRKGCAYAVTYERSVAAPIDQRNVELALMTFVLSDRARGLLAHGCGFALPTGAIVLSPGVSGAGKSTLARLLRTHVSGIRILNDDRVILTREADGVHAWGAPWPGSEGIANPFAGRLSALAFIRQASACGLRAVSARDAAHRLYRVLALPLWNAHAIAEALAFIESRLLALPRFEIAYPATAWAASWIADTLSEQLADVGCYGQIRA